MSNSENNRLTGVILDQTLFILENYIEIMTIFHNTQAQITRQQQAMVRKMNVLLTELRRQQSIDTISENVRSSFSSFGSFQDTDNNNRSTNNERETFPSRFEQSTRNISRELFRPPARSQNSRNRDLFRRTFNNNNNNGSPPRRGRNTSSTTTTTTTSNSSFQTQPTQSLFNFGNTSNANTNTNNNTNVNTTNETSPSTSNNPGIVLNFERVFPFGETPNVTTTGTTFQTPFGPSFGGNLFENVPVFPSPEQIENSTTTMHFQDISNPMNTTCPITMETFSPSQIVVKINHCGHIFNQTHLHSWFRTHVRCPVCRHDVRDDVSGNVSSAEESTNTTINFTPLPSINENREEERTQNNQPAAGDGNSDQQLNDDITSVSRMLLQALMTPSTGQNNTQLNTPLQPSITTSIRSTTVPLSWSHMMPSVPLSPLSINQQTSISPSTGSRNNETPPSPDAQSSTAEQNTQEDTSGSAEELLEQVD